MKNWYTNQNKTSRKHTTLGKQILKVVVYGIEKVSPILLFVSYISELNSTMTRAKPLPYIVYIIHIIYFICIISQLRQFLVYQSVAKYSDVISF